MEFLDGLALAALPVLSYAAWRGLLAWQIEQWAHAERLTLARAEQDRARHPPPANVPSHVTLTGGHYTWPALATALPAPQPVLDVPGRTVVPSLAEVEAAGLLDRPDVLTGFRTDATWQAVQGPLFRAIAEGHCIGVAGLSGSGKTTFLRLQAYALARRGGQLAVLDPHLHTGPAALATTLAPLRASFLAPPSDDPGRMAQVVAKVDAIKQARLAGKDLARHPVVLLVDEFTRLMRTGGPLAQSLQAFLESATTEGRKVNVGAIVAGQNWRADRAGGTAFRDLLGDRVVFRTIPKQARYLLTDGRATTEAATLATGHALYETQDGTIHRLIVPDASHSAVARLARSLVAPSRGSVADVSHPATEITPDATGATEAIRLFFTGIPMIDAIEQAFHVSRKNPNAFGPARHATEAALRHQQKGT